MKIKLSEAEQIFRLRRMRDNVRDYAVGYGKAAIAYIAIGYAKSAGQLATRAAHHASTYSRIVSDLGDGKG
jgi:hypothetical protein